MNDTDRIKELEEEIAVLRSRLRTDELTRLLNRRGIKEEFGTLFREAKHALEREHRRDVDFDDIAVVFVDLDNFKSLNDDYGHEVGDQALEKSARLFAESVRGIDRIGRYGGEEFVIALPGASEKDAYEKAVSLNRKLGELSLGEEIDYKITASIGVATLQSTDAEDLQELIQAADEAMYEAKHNRGKNTVVRFSELDGANE